MALHHSFLAVEEGAEMLGHWGIELFSVCSWEEGANVMISVKKKKRLIITDHKKIDTLLMMFIMKELRKFHPRT